MREVCVAVCLFLSLVEVHPLTEYPYISFMGENLTNHSYVGLTLVGTDTSDPGNTVRCHTDLPTRCTNAQGTHSGDWYFPDSHKVGSRAPGRAIYQNHTVQRVDLLQKNSRHSPSGLYSCGIRIITDITDTNTSKQFHSRVFIGLYASEGEISIVGGVNLSMNTLTCISTGGPATTVTWTRDSIEVTEGAQTVLDDPVTAQYTHTLTVTEAGRQGGLYTCTVANNKPSTASASITVQVTLPPSGVTAVRAGPTSILVSWNLSSNANGYIIDYHASCSGKHDRVDVTGSSKNNHTLTGLQNGDTYTVSIVAISDGFPSESVIATPVTYMLVSESIQTIARTATSVYLNWTSAGSETLYFIMSWKTATIGGCSRTGSSDINARRFFSTANNYILTGLEEDSCYIITVTAFLANNSEDKSATTAVTLHSVPSAPPSSVSVSEETSSSITVQWGPVDCIHRNGLIKGYSVQYGSETVSVSGDSSGGMYVISGLMPSTTYSIQVAAKTSAGRGPYSTAIDQLTSSEAPQFIAVITRATSISLSLINATTDNVSYEVTWQTDDIGGCSGGNHTSSTTVNDCSTIDIIGLEEDSLYTIAGTVSNSAGSIATINVTTMTPEAAPLAAPVSVSVAKVTSSNITVQWRPMDCIHRNGDIRGYSVQYGSETVSVSGDSSGGMYVISGLRPTTTYSMKVAAINCAGTGPYSSPLTQLTATEIINNGATAVAISLSWTSASTENVSYEVMWKTDDIGGCSGGSDMNSTTITDGSTSYDIMGLEEITTYTITVTASNSIGSSAVSNEVIAVTRKAAPSAPPSSVSVSEVTSSSITVQWRPMDCIHRNGLITGYSVQYGSETVSVSGDSSGGLYVISGLMPSTTYSIQVAAKTSAGRGPYSAAVKQQTAVEAPVVTAVGTKVTSISLSWTSAGSENVSYELMWQTDDIGGCSGDSDMNSTTVTDGSTSYDIMKLEENSYYTIVVTASNSPGKSAVSNNVTAVTLMAAPTGPPSPVNTTATPTSITVLWGPVDCVHRNGEITGYLVHVMRNNEIAKDISVSGDIRQVTISELRPSTQYNISVAAVNNNSTGVYSIAVPVVTKGAVELISTTNQTISLKLSSGQNFAIFYSNTDCPRGTYDGIINATEEVYTLTGLEEGTRYFITVTVALSEGRSEEYSLVATTATTSPSAPPSSVSVSGVTSSSITVQWGPVDCIHRNGDITGYSVQYKEVKSGSIHNMTVSGSNTTEATIINLMPSTMYIVQVAAINDAGDGIYSDPLSSSTNHSTEHSETAAATSAVTEPSYSDSMTRETPTDHDCENGGDHSPLANMAGTAIIIGALFLLFTITILLIIVVRIRCSRSESVRMKTRLSKSPSSPSRRQRMRGKETGSNCTRKQKRCPDSIPTADNEAYNVVKLSREAECTEAVYETVFTARSVPPSTSQPTIDAEY